MFLIAFALSGPGDAIAALLLGWGHRRPGRLQEAVVHAVAALLLDVNSGGDAFQHTEITTFS